MVENNPHRTRNIVLKIVAVFVLLAVMAGIACLTFKLGERHALREGNLALQYQKVQGNQGENDRFIVPMQRNYIQGYGLMGPGMRGIGIGAIALWCLGGLFGLFLILGAIRLLFWGPRWHHRFPYPPQGPIPYNESVATPAAPAQKTTAAKPAGTRRARK
jgi:hypothetical protein